MPIVLALIIIGFCLCRWYRLLVVLTIVGLATYIAWAKFVSEKPADRSAIELRRSHLSVFGGTDETASVSTEFDVANHGTSELESVDVRVSVFDCLAATCTLVGWRIERLQVFAPRRGSEKSRGMGLLLEPGAGDG